MPSWRSHLSSFLTHDFSPWANRYVYWLKTPLGVLIVAALAALVCGLFVASQGLVLFAAIVFVILLGIAWPWVGLSGIQCELSFSQRRAREGNCIPVTLKITNRWPWPVWGLAVEKGFFVGEGESDAMAVALARIGGWSQSEFHWDFTPGCRGLYPHEEPEITTAFPFGLWKVTRPIAICEQLLVWPQTFDLGELPLPPGRQQWVTTPSDHRAGDDGETIGVRPYRLGDSLRSIHWAQTARYDRFIVCERQGAAQATTVILVDADPAWHSAPGDNSSLEWNIRIAASIASNMLEQGTRVRLCIGRRQLEAEPGNTGLRRVLDLLAKFDAGTDANSPTDDVTSRQALESDFIVRITTDLAPADSNRFANRIVLHTTAFAEGDNLVLHELADRKAWIEVDDPHRVPAQLLRQWQQRSREVWSGA